MIAYDPEAWHDLFVAMAGAAAALAGLLFVAVSINLREILASPALPRRAAESLSIMVTALIVSILMLTPGQSTELLAIELVVVGLAGGLLQLVPRLRILPDPEGRALWTVVPVVGIVASFLPIAIAGVSLLVGAGGGLYWLVVALILGLITAVSSAWVLLVEIQR